MPLGLSNQNMAICHLELADRLTTRDAADPSVNVEVDVLADEPHGTITQRCMTTTDMLAGWSTLAIATIPASQSESRLTAASLNIGCAVPTVIDPSTVTFVLATSDQRYTVASQGPHAAWIVGNWTDTQLPQQHSARGSIDEVTNLGRATVTECTTPISWLGRPTSLAISAASLTAQVSAVIDAAHGHVAHCTASELHTAEGV